MTRPPRRTNDPPSCRCGQTFELQSMDQSSRVIVAKAHHVNLSLAVAPVRRKHAADEYRVSKLQGWCLGKLPR